MRKNKIILVGAINEGGVATCGETMKNQLFVKRFKELFDKVITVDTINCKKRPWVLVKLFFTLLFNCRAKVIISASGAAAKLINFLYYVPINRNVYFWVVGGDIHIGIQRGLYNIKALASLKHILVQGKCMVTELDKYGLTNVIHVPNSKPITFTPTITPKKEGESYRFVFLSRVHPNKGVGEIVEAVRQLNEKGLKDKFIVDLYGKIEPGYEDKFNSEIASLDNVEYKGFLNLTNDEGYQTLSTYDVMLFPTYWSGEGFPGIVIDANISGLPIIASDWNMNKEVVLDGITGYMIPPHNSEALAVQMQRFICNEVDLFAMKDECVRYVQQFDYCNVLSEKLMKQINLL